MEKHMKQVILIAGMALMALAVPAFADTLYTNGPINGTVQAWIINSGYVVSNTFALAEASTVTSADFGVYTSTLGDTLNQVVWTISSGPEGSGTVYGSGTASTNTGNLGGTYWGPGYAVNNQFTYAVYAETIDIPNISLIDVGTYWFTLQDAVTNNGSWAAWDINNGPSAAWLSAINGVVTDAFGTGSNSNSFSINGNTVPEPVSFILLGSGLSLIGLAAWRRRK